MYQQKCPIYRNSKAVRDMVLFLMQVINTMLVTIVEGKMPDYPWIGWGEPTHGGGGRPSYSHNGIKQRWEAMAILHTTGIHKQVGAPKKVRKKGAHLLCFEKGENGGLTFFSPFFNRGIKRQYPNNCLLVQNVHTTFRRREKKSSM